MTEIQVKLPTPYKIEIGNGLLNSVGKKLHLLKPNASKVLVVSDSNVAPLYSQIVQKSLNDAGYNSFLYSFEAGEENKIFSTYQSIINQAANCGLTRDDLMVALGGGVVGDLTGFCAATYMRGVDVVQIPTTLLAGIDSSIGGKTGINILQGKNLVGAFHQPIAVYFDTDVLKSLPEQEWKNGLGEGVKYAVLQGGRLYDILAGGLGGDTLEEFISLCANIKANIVEKDEKEGGERKLLNLGHTIGHAIEKLSNYSEPHGVSVAKGLFMIAKASHKAGILSKEHFLMIEQLLQKYGFDLQFKIDKRLLLETVCADKKMNGDGDISFVNIRAIGSCCVEKTDIKSFGDYVL